jgi:hypothetical protein
LVVIMTELQDFCQEPRTMQELVDADFATHAVYNAVRRGELTNTKATDDWGRKLHGKGLFLSTITTTPYNAAALVAAWSA